MFVNQLEKGQKFKLSPNGLTWTVFEKTSGGTLNTVMVLISQNHKFRTINKYNATWGKPAILVTDEPAAQNGHDPVEDDEQESFQLMQRIEDPDPEKDSVDWLNIGPTFTTAQGLINYAESVINPGFEFMFYVESPFSDGNNHPNYTEFLAYADSVLS